MGFSRGVPLLPVGVRAAMSTQLVISFRRTGKPRLWRHVRLFIGLRVMALAICILPDQSYAETHYREKEHYFLRWTRQSPAISQPVQRWMRFPYYIFSFGLAGLCVGFGMFIFGWSDRLWIAIAGICLVGVGLILAWHSFSLWESSYVFWPFVSP